MAFATSLPPLTISTFNPSPYSKKRTFLLLEVLICILLVSICLIPLIQSPIHSYQAQMQFLEEMEGERLAEWTFSEIKEKLLNHEIAWEKLPSTEETAGPFSLPSIQVEIPGAKQKTIERTFRLRCYKKGEKIGPRGEIYRMLHVEIDFHPKLSQKEHKKEKGDYSYRLMVQKIYSLDMVLAPKIKNGIDANR